MKIVDRKTIAQIQNEFSDLYEGLKLEFYQKKHAEHRGSRKEDQYPSFKKLADIRSTKKSGELTIAENMSTAELENAFEDKFGLHVQVFRKSGNIWLQTSATDDWSLKKQNDKAKNFIEDKDKVNLQ